MVGRRNKSSLVNELKSGGIVLPVPENARAGKTIPAATKFQVMLRYSTSGDVTPGSREKARINARGKNAQHRKTPVDQRSEADGSGHCLPNSIGAAV